jgi:hypothetical protein
MLMGNQNLLLLPLILAALGAALVVLGLTILFRRNRQPVNPPSNSPEKKAAPAPTPVERRDDAIYQENRLVARVVGPELNPEAREFHFQEIHNSDDLMLPDECEFQKYRLLIQRVGYATWIDRDAPENGRVLRGVVAEILGYREQ